MIRIRVNMSRTRNTGFPNPWCFNTDPDPWIRFTTLRIRIQPRILPISWVSFKTPKKRNDFPSFLAYYLQEVHLYPDPHCQYGSKSKRAKSMRIRIRILRKYRYGKEVTDLMMLKTSTLPPKISRHEALLYIPSETCGSKHFYTCRQCCGSGSGIRCLFDPWIRDPE